MRTQTGVNIAKPFAGLGAGTTQAMLLPAPSHSIVHLEGRPIRISVYYSWAQLEERVPEWECILRGHSRLSIFSTPEWLDSWWKSFGSNKKMFALTFSNDLSELLGLALLYVDDSSSPRFPKLNFLRFIGDGSGDSDNLDLIFKPDYESTCAAALVEWLRTSSDWHLCVLNTLPSSSTAANALLQTLKSQHWKITVTARPHLTIDLPDTWDEYLARLSNNQRIQIRYLRRRLEKAYRVGVFKCVSSEDLSHCLEALFELHQQRWKVRSEQGTFASAARRSFYLQMARSFLERKWLEFWFLELNGKRVAAQFGFRYRDTVYSLQEGFDPNYAVHKVGFVLRSYVLQRLISEGIRCYDFLGGLGHGKEHWRPRSCTYSDLHFGKPWSRGSAYLTAVGQASASKTWLREHLPAPAWNALRALGRVARTETSSPK